MTNVSKELMSEVLNYEVDTFLGLNKNEIDYTCCRDENEGYIDISINLYEFVHLNLKQWANFKNVFNIIDWSGEPEEILAKAEELMNETN